MRLCCIVGVIGGAILLGACTSRETIQVAYGDRLEELEPGMPEDEFNEILPEADEFQRAFTGAGQISVYRLTHRYKQGRFNPVRQELYFRFVNHRLDRWGYSDTWGG